jgi:hypothetical protein
VQSTHGCDVRPYPSTWMARVISIFAGGLPKLFYSGLEMKRDPQF